MLYFEAPVLLSPSTGIFFHSCSLAPNCVLYSVHLYITAVTTEKGIKWKSQLTFSLALLLLNQIMIHLLLCCLMLIWLGLAGRGGHAYLAWPTSPTTQHKFRVGNQAVWDRVGQTGGLARWGQFHANHVWVHLGDHWRTEALRGCCGPIK